MRKKVSLLGLLCAVICLLTGCQSQEENKGYTVYYVNPEGTKLTEVSYDPGAETFEEMMEELLGQLSAAPGGSISALPSNVSINGYERSIDALRIDFSKEYYEMDNISEVLLRAAVIKTISQIPGVTKIMITVEGAQLVDEDGDLVPAMDAASFIDTKEGGINSYQYATLTFYFADKTGSRHVSETREVHYSSNMVLERVVLEQMIKGPQKSGAKAVIPESTKILTLGVLDGICTVNFDSEFGKAPSESNVAPETAIYALVNAICGACDGIKGVRFEINGENDLMFRDKVDLAQTFTPQMHLVETEAAKESMTEKVSEDMTELLQTEAVTSLVQQESEQIETELLTDAETEEVQAVVHGNAAVGVDPLMKKE